jgi:hypothetical protein
LAQLVKFELNETLENIVPKGPLSNVALELVEWAERQGRTAELIGAAVATRPNNPEVAALAQLLQPVAAAPPPAASDLQRRLRAALLDQFPRPADIEMLVSDSLGQTLGQVANGSNQTEVCFNLVKWLWIDRPGRLRPLLTAAIRERPNSEDLKALQRELSAG